MLPLARWHIGPVKPAGFECLLLSIRSFLRLYRADVIVCFNCDKQQLPKELDYPLFDQNEFRESTREPMGVAWKLYPPRMDITRKEIVIDNDIIFRERIEEIDYFLDNDVTLATEDPMRCYGRFDKHVPSNLNINSGIYGMPENFDLENYVEFYAGPSWELNAYGIDEFSKTYDEQGIIATAISSYKKNVIIPITSVTFCDRKLIYGKALHFIGLNRVEFHRPYQQFKADQRKLYL